MLDRTYPGQVCSIARALEVVGERWTLLVVRDALLGVTRFEDFRARLGVASNVLAARLDRLCAEDLLERRAYQERPERHEYVPTAKARDLFPALFALMKWGDRHYLAEAGLPRLTLHRGGCGGTVDERLRCGRCGARVEFADVQVVPGPGLPSGAAARGEAPATTG